MVFYKFEVHQTEDAQETIRRHYPKRNCEACGKKMKKGNVAHFKNMVVCMSCMNKIYYTRENVAKPKKHNEEAAS